MHLTQRSGVIYFRFYQRVVSQTLGDIKVTLTSNKSPYTASQNSHCYIPKTKSCNHFTDLFSLSILDWLCSVFYNV